MKFLNLFLVVFLIASCTSSNKEIKLEEGISYDLAKYRKQQISDIVYNLHFKIPAEKTKSIASKSTINFTVKDLENDVYLDFNEATSKLKSVKINSEEVFVNHQKEHLILDKTKLILGLNEVEILFDAGETSLNRNNEFLYTLLVPDRASTLFPSFDQPDLKAKYNLRITAPKDWKVMAGGFEESAIEIDDFVEHTFATTDKMSSYLFSFVAGKFSETTKNPGAFDMRFLYRENNQEKIDESVNEIFKIHQNSIDFLENYTSVKFPFQKMDFAAIPPFQYGGMEHVGAIQYRESSLFLDKNATQSRKLRRAKLIAHETSHMWFGDLVTMKWFNDVWMKEVFANFMADKIVNPVYPEINHTLSFMMSHYPSAYSEDRTKGTNPIRQPLDNLKNAGSLYGRIIYNKAPIMMRQLEYLLGESQFQKGIQEYIKTYANSNADWLELVEILDKKSAGNIKNWSEVWVNSSGRPIFTEEIETNEKGNVTKFIIHQKAEDGSEKVWTQSFKIQLKDARGFVRNINIKNMGSSFDITEATKDFKPGQVLYNINGFGYGVFPIYKDKIDNYKLIRDEVSRGYQFINLYENMLLGNVTPKNIFMVFFDALKSEKNELITNYLSGRIQNIYWTFLTETQKDEIQVTTENNLMKLLQQNLPKNIKKTIFNLYQSTVVSEDGKEKLYKIWNGDLKIDQLFLNENNLTSLALQLAVLEHTKSKEIIAEQELNISNPDQLERFKWLLPAVSKDVIIRNSFMKSLFEKENREKESWVQSGLSYFHHPLRQNNAIEFLPEILNKLEEVQLTGDIFFPKGWLASTIGNYSSKEAYEILQQFLNENPDYNPILLKKLHQTTDDLTRAQNIKK
ncbi:M1 family metallopeptidase [Polaribacter dokdonensis]|uniref:Aminopeptidase N n=1 Tax=Polaribacter dokdonensis DSW-5 TaxID=1300348 RepID=A0A0M9CGS0_9FLAO|nr:M1 family aminopeptidase [Polaribacter dokdonensis]KOY52153.1 Peptidase family M1 [Polaribacter dokdonensis DSW-5]SED94395.1 aminopeptidase N [Polaribacter dokdonensis DSW-5]